MEQLRIYADQIVSFSQSPSELVYDSRRDEQITLQELIAEDDFFRTIEYSADRSAALFNPADEDDEDSDALVLLTGNSITFGFSQPITLERAGVNVPGFGYGTFFRSDSLRVEARLEGGDFIELTVRASGSNFPFLGSELGSGPFTVSEIRLTSLAPESVSRPYFVEGFNLIDNIELTGYLPSGEPPIEPPQTPTTSDDILLGDDSVDVELAESTLIDVLANDVYPTEQNLMLEIVTQPEFGTAVVEGNLVRFSAPPPEIFSTSEQAVASTNAHGPTTFTYSVTLPDGSTSTAEVAVDVDGPDLALAGQPEARIFAENGLGSIARTWSLGEAFVITQSIVNLGKPYDLTEEDVRVEFDFRLSPVTPDGGNKVSYSITNLGTNAVTQSDPGEEQSNSLFEITSIIDTEDDPLGFRPDFPVKTPGYYWLLSHISTDELERTTLNNFSNINDDAFKVLITDRSLLELTLDTVRNPPRSTPQNDTIINTSGVDQTVNGGDGRDTFISDTVRERGNLLFELITTPAEPVSETEEIALTPGSATVRERALAPNETVAFTDLDTGVTTTLQNVERIALADGVYVFDMEGDDLEYAYRVYDAAFGRTPDEAGLSFWNDQMEQGNVSRESLAQFFVDSPEFAALYPSSSDEEFITALYANALRREPDQAGFDFWSDAFATGELSRAQMLVFFADSPENMERNATNYDDGLWLIG